MKVRNLSSPISRSYEKSRDITLKIIDKTTYFSHNWSIHRLIEKVIEIERQREKLGGRERERRREATARGRETRYKVQSNIDRAMQEPLASWWVPTCVSNAYHGVASRMHARPCLCFEGKRRRPLLLLPRPSSRQATKESIDCVTEAQARTNNTAVVASPFERGRSRPIASYQHCRPSVRFLRFHYYYRARKCNRTPSYNSTICLSRFQRFGQIKLDTNWSRFLVYG